MRITDLHISSFGHWTGLQLTDLSDITVIHGPNEAGKSTLLQFVRAVLYGFSPTRHRRFVPPVYDGRVGGSINVTAPNGRFTIRRLLPPSGKLEDHEQSELSVRSLDGSIQGKQLITTLLAGVDDSIFHNVFAVGLTEMQHLGTLSDTEAGEQLYGLAMGTDRVSLIDVKRELETARQSLFSDDDAASELTTLFERREHLRREIQASADDNRRWGAMLDERNSIAKEIAELEQTKKETLANGDIKQMTSQVRGLWSDANKVHSQLKKLGTIPKGAIKSLHRIRKLTAELNEKRQKWSQIKSQRAKLSAKAASEKSGESLTPHAAEIEQMHNRRGKLKSLEADIQRLEVQVDEIEFELQSELERAGITSDFRPDTAPDITHELVNSLQVPAREAEEAERSIAEFEREATELRRQAESIERQLKTVAQNAGTSNFGQRLERLEQTMQALRQRMQFDTREEKLKRNIKQLREEARDWRERQVLPWRGLMALGCVFSIGVAMTLAGMFGHYAGLDEHRRWMLGIMGICVSLVAPIAKNASEFGAQRGEDACEEEIDELKKQLELTQQQILEANKILPPSNQPLVSQLQDTEEQLAQMEEYIPLEGQRKELIQDAEAAERRSELAKQQHQDAKTRWSEILRSARLSSSLTPEQFETLSEQVEVIDRIKHRWTTAKDQLRQKKLEFEQIEQRVQFFISLAGLIPDNDELESQIGLLSKTVRGQRQQDEERETLHRKWRQLGRDQERIAEAAKKIQQRRTQLMEQCGVVDQDDLRSLMKRSQRASTLRKERDTLVKQIVEAMGDQVSFREISKQLGSKRFLSRLTKMESDQDNLKRKLEALHLRHQELAESHDSLIGRRDVSGKRIELSEVEAKLQRGLEQWRVFAATSAILDTVRQSYESDRQPETLAEASGYLHQMTQGRYTRIWTPFGESSLSVDDKHGQGLPVEVLSRGTREQVFLSLRMALVASYGRRGSKLPLILDDVFVNFDRERAEAAAATIRDFALQGHQVLVFTCHDHIREMFAKIQVEICELPKAADLAVGHTTPIRPSKAEIPQPTHSENSIEHVPNESNNAADQHEDGSIYYYLTADELAEIAYNDDFFGDDGTFFPLAGARNRTRSHAKPPTNARPIREFVAKKEMD